MGLESMSQAGICVSGKRLQMTSTVVLAAATVPLNVPVATVKHRERWN